MKTRIFFLIAMMCCAGCLAQSNNSNVNNNNNTVIINSQPVIKETVVKEKTKVVYKDRPVPATPSRVARKLPAPVVLQGYLWVYPEDLGSFSSVPSSVIANINRQGKFGRDNWRVPTEEELALMKNEADKVGLGPLSSYMYAGRYSGGTVRLVSTGPSLSDKRNARAQEEAAERKRRAEAASAEKRRAEQAAAAERMRAAEQRATEERIRREKKEEQSRQIQTGRAVVYNSVLWQTKNYDAYNKYDAGRCVTEKELPDGWRLPTIQEFKRLIYKCAKDGNCYVYGNLMIPEGTYLVTDNGKTKIYNLKMDVVFNDNKGLIRAVMDVVD